DDFSGFGFRIDAYAIESSLCECDDAVSLDGDSPKRPCVVRKLPVSAFPALSYYSHERKLFMWCKTTLLLFMCVTSALGQDTRHFTFHYGFTVKNLPAGERVRIWIPAAHSDAFQEVKVISANGDLTLKKTHESTFGNEMY